MSPLSVNATVHEMRGTSVGRITFDRADKKNALTPEMIHAAIDAVRSFSSPGQAMSIGAIVLDGHGAAFCSGFDLTLCKDNSDALRPLLTGLSDLVRALRRAPVPVVIAAHGAALAGGCALLGGGDVVVSHHDAKIGYPVVRLGISPAVSAPFLAHSIGHGNARERLLDSTLISGWQAFKRGLVHECLDDAGRVRDHALALAHALASKPRAGMIATKAWINQLDGSALDHDADRALAASLSLVGSLDERQRLTKLWKNAPG